MRRRRRFLLDVLGASLVALLLPASASAQGQSGSDTGASVSGEVRVILGTDEGAGVDEALAGLAPQLSRQFTRFSGFRQHSAQRFSLTPGNAISLGLPGGGSATIQVVGVEGDTWELRVTIPGGGGTIRTSGGFFFVGGPRVAGGTLILAIST